MTTKTTLVFIPGGPWISGEYWDFFVNHYFQEYPTKRIVLLNHENEYTQGSRNGISNLLQDLENKIECETDISIIAHSYGCLITLMTLNKSVKVNIKSIIFICMPFTNKRSKHTQDLLKDVKSTKINNEETFQNYFKYIFPLYFSPTFEFGRYHWITNQSYMEGNEELLINDINILECLEILDRYKEHIKMIFADNDLVIDEIWKNHVSEYTLIKNSGHFPMLEQQEELACILKKFV